MESHISKNDKNVLQMILDPSLPFDGDDDGTANGQLGVYTGIFAMLWI